MPVSGGGGLCSFCYKPTASTSPCPKPGSDATHLPGSPAHACLPAPPAAPAARPADPVVHVPSLPSPGPPHVQSEDRATLLVFSSVWSRVLSRQQPPGPHVLGSGEFPSPSFPTSIYAVHSFRRRRPGVCSGRAGRRAAMHVGPSAVFPPDAGADSVGVIGDSHQDGVLEAVFSRVLVFVCPVSLAPLEIPF